MCVFFKRVSVLTLTFVLVSAGVLAAQVPTVVVRENDTLPGGSGEVVSSISGTTQNDVGGYLFLVTTDDVTVHRFWGDVAGGPGTVLRTEDQYGSLLQTSFEFTFGFSDSGEIGYSASSNDTSSGETSLDGAWVDDLVILNEGDSVPGLAGQFSTFNSRPGITTDGQPYWIGGYGPATSTNFRALFFGTTILLKGGDSIPGVAELITDEGLDFDFRMSGQGSNYIIPVGLDASSATNQLLVLNGQAMMAEGDILREGTTVPAAVGGIAGEAWSNFDYLGITETGSYMITGDTNGDTSADEFVMVDGRFVLREGDTIDSLTISGAIEGGAFNEVSDWAVIWDVDDAGNNVEALIVNGNLVLKEGDLIDWNGDDVVDALDQGATLTNFSGINSISISERNPSDEIFVCFQGDCDVAGTDLSGGFRMRIGPPSVVLVDNFDVVQGEYFSGTTASLRDSDNIDVSARRGRLDVASRVFVEFTGSNAEPNPTTFSFTIESSVFARTRVVQSVDLFNFQTNDWDEVDVRDASSFIDSVVVIEPAGDLSRYVSVTGDVRSRVRYQSPVARQRFAANIDQVSWFVE